MPNTVSLNDPFRTDIVIGSLKGNITATVKGESPEEVIKELGRIYHFSVSKQHNTLLIGYIIGYIISYIICYLFFCSIS